MLCFLGNALMGWAEGDGGGDPNDLSTLSIEQLINLPVTTVSKQSESMFRAPAAVAAISGDDLRRSGATTLPDALRMVPGLQVGQVDAHTWAVSSRGFNDTFANKLLVLIDGRSVYTPLFSGVYWDVQDTLLQDIDRIEVVRGPGATLWGANAVNGVINIITKNARETQGTLIMGGGGTEETAFAGARVGGRINQDTYYRVYAKYFNRDSSALLDGTTANDRWEVARGGFRVDRDAGEANRWTLQGDGYGGSEDQTTVAASLMGPTFRKTISETADVAGGNVLGRWTHEFSADSELQLQSYFDATRRSSELLEEDRNTFDVDFHHRFPLGSRHEVMWGTGYRLMHDQLRDSFGATFDKTSRTDQLINFFLQDDVTLVRDRLHLTLGSKFEHNDYTGFEVQPGGRLRWTPAEEHTVWASVSRAVRTPSRAESDIRLNVQVIPVPVPTVVSFFGNPDFKSEELLAYEVGYRVRPHRQVAFDVAAFYNVYDRLGTAEAGGFAPDPTLPGSPFVASFDLENKASGETWGVELNADWQPLDWWRWRVGYSFLDMQLHRDSSSTDSGVEHDEGKSPRHQVSLRSSMDLPGNLELDLWGRFVDRLPALGIDSYFSLDARLAWKPKPNLEFSIVGRNLLQSRHEEFAPSVIATQRTAVQRGVYGQVTFRF